MCGIAGILSWHEPPDADALGRMIGRLEHRGPDDSGVLVRGPMALGHRRLAIIDLSPSGHQPMSDHAGGFTIVFNGEIYNYRELRQELTAQGSRFSSDSDTEVILEAYKAWGPGCLERLNGMFAFALWEERNRRLLLARDRLGEKPLLLHPLPEGGLVFASELKALREHPAVERRINPRALGQFLSLNYVLGDESIVHGVEKLAPAQALIVQPDRPWQRIEYWDLAAPFRHKDPHRDPAEAAAGLRRLFDDAVRLRLVSDVPLGAFLSGGCDSSAVAAAMCQSTAPGQVRTFSIGFQEQSFSELPEARYVASRLGIDHQDRIVEAAMASRLPGIVYQGDEPFADTSAIPVYYLAEFAREHVTVCLSGDGADEVFAGYPTYQADRLRHLTGWIPPWMVSRLARAVDALLPVSFHKVSLDYKLRQFLRGHGLSAPRAHYSWREIFSEEEKRGLLRPEVAEAVLERDPFDSFRVHFERVADLHPLDQALYTDIKTWLPDDILVKLDRFTMAHSLEARPPFLDHRLVEFAAGLPVGWKLRGLRGKHLLKQSQRRRLPGRTLRRRKVGFNAPVSQWFGTTLGALSQHARGPAVSEWVRPEAVQQLLAQHERGEHDNGLKLFGLTCLGLWMDQYL